MSEPICEHRFNCPYCNAPISVIIDLSAGNQEYIEDCEVCCNPISLTVQVTNMELVGFDAESIEQ